MLANALLYASRGWYVLPVFGCSTHCACGNELCVNVGKHPQSVLAPQGLLNATTDPDVIRGWFAKDPTINIAIALTLSGLIAIDVDVYKGDKERLDALEDRLGALPETLIQQSGSGDGYHILFKAPPFPIRGQLGDVTMRGRNYIVVSPSRHKSGNVYQWINDLPPAELPEAWQNALRKPNDINTTGLPISDPGWLPSQSIRVAECIAYLQSEPGEIYQVSPSATTWNVIRTAIRGYGIRENAYELIQEYYNDRCVPPWSDDRLAYKISKAYNEATLPEWGERLKPLAVSLAEIGITAPIEDAPTAESLLLEQAYADVTRALNNSVNGSTASLLFEPAPSLFSREFPPEMWLVRGLITEDTLAAIATEPKAAKTWAATEIALAVASGTDVFGKFPVKQGPVAYFYAEDMAQHIRNRLRALSKARNLDPAVACADLHIQSRGRNLDITKISDLALIVASVRKIGPIKLLVLDPLRDIHTGEENSADSMAPVMKHLKILSTLLNCTVLFVHHSNKSSDGNGKRGGARMRGSNVIWGSIDCAMYFENFKGNGENEFGNTVEVQVKGAKGAGFFDLTLNIIDGADGTAIDARWKIEKSEKSTMIATTGNPATLESRICEVVDVLGVYSQPMSVRELQKKIGGGNTLLCAATLECEKRGFITHPEGRAHGWVLTPLGRRFFSGQKTSNGGE